MKIKINLDKEEVKDIIKTHVFKKFPVDPGNQEIHVDESYDEWEGYVVTIEPKLEPAEEIINEN